MVLTEEQYPGLPKWPMAFVTGKQVTPEQAQDIIFRTDSSLQYPSPYGMGNDRAFKDHCARVFGWDRLFALEEDEFKITHERKGQEAWEQLRKRIPGYNCTSQIKSALTEELGTVATEYVGNSWLSTAYIGGPHGWMSPSGVIHHDGHNWGKWPSVSEIVRDWEVLLEAFPYIEVVNTLFSGESCEADKQPVCTILVGNGKIEVHSPDLSLHKVAPKSDHDMNLSGIFSMMRGNYAHEQGWPPGWVEAYGEKSQAALRKVAPFLL